MPRADNTSFVLNDFILHSPFTGVARPAYLSNILHCTIIKQSSRGHDIVTKIIVLIGIYRDSAPCLYCVATSTKTRPKNSLVGTIDCITRVGRLGLCAHHRRLAAVQTTEPESETRPHVKSHCSHLGRCGNNRGDRDRKRKRSQPSLIDLDL